MKWLPIIVIVFAIPVHAQPIVIPDTGVEAQERPFWCWAAVSVVGIRSFEEQGEFKHLTQVQVVARRYAGATNLQEASVAAVAAAITDNETECKKEEQCNLPKAPLLFDIKSDHPGPNQALSLKALKTDIERQHPVIIRWIYVEDPHARAERGIQLPSFEEDAPMIGRHAMLITGVNEETKEVRIFDPLPVGSQDLSLHEVWMPYSQYLDPLDHLGVRVDAEHRREQYRMRRLGSPAPSMDGYPKVPVPARTFEPGEPGGLEPLRTLEPVIRDYLNGRVFRRSSGTPRTGKMTTGTPFPIVVVRAGELLNSGGRIEPLLAARTPAYVVPVLENGKVVDSFQLLRNRTRWVQGGYSNSKIASLVSRLREEKSGHSRTAESFYLLSIPELESFYVAHGFEAKAELISLDNEARGEFAPARKVLGELIARVQNVLAKARSKDPTRPIRPTPQN